MPQRGVSDTTGTPNRRLALFLRATVFDYVLVLVACAGLVYTVSYGFNSAPDLRANVALIVGACAALLVPLYVGSWSKRAIPIGGVLYVAMGVGLVALVSSMAPAPAELFVDGQVNDVEENYAVFGLVLMVVPLIVFLLSRRTVGVAVLLFVAALSCGVIQFLYRDWIVAQPGTTAALLVYLAIGALFMVQGYRQGVMQSHIAKKTSFAGSFAYGVVGAAACVAVGVGVYLLVVAPLAPGTLNVKPFEDYYSRPVIEYNGTYEEQMIESDDQTTSELNDEMIETSDEQEGSNDNSQTSSTGGNPVTVALDVFNQNDWNNAFDVISISLPPSLRFLLWLVPVAIVALIVYLRYRCRAVRLRRLEGRPYAERAVYLYNFFMDRFARLKIDKPATMTPLEFALASEHELALFMRNRSEADFLGITLIYQRAAYGAGNVSERDYRYLTDYYDAFFRNAHERMGHLKWVLRGFWRI